MKKFITVLAVAGLVLAFASSAQATITATGNFDLIRTHPWATFDDPNPGDWKLTYFDGSLGAGTLNVAGGSLFDANGKPVSVGWGAGTSTITVTGPGSELRSSNGFKAGVNTSHGDLIVEAGGLVDVQGQLMIGTTGLGTALVTGVNSKLITDTLLQFGQQTGGAGSILTVEDSGLVQTPAIKFGFDPSGGYLHMGVGGVLAVLGDKTLGTPFVAGAGNLFTIQGAGSYGEIQYLNGATWENMTGATEGTDYDLTYHSSSFIVNGQELNGYTVLTMPYAVTYDANTATGGDAPTAQSKWYGVALTLASDIGTLEKTGYTFTGWNTADDGTDDDYALGASYTADAAVTLFAQWNRPPVITQADPLAVTILEDGQFATGGDPIYQDGSDRVHVFSNSATFTPSTDLDVEYLVVGGGGGGGGSFHDAGSAGGGGGGDFLTGSTNVSVQAYSITVGAGGSGGLGGSNQSGDNRGGTGANSSFAGIIASGGGGGGRGVWNGDTTHGPGKDGASGGGGGGSHSGGTGTPGGNGGTGNNSGVSAGAGGGGGAVGNGANGSNSAAGDGGDGDSSSITGSTEWYAGGGGGGKSIRNNTPTVSDRGNGGNGGGGNGGYKNSAVYEPTAGTANTGGGGGGGGAQHPSSGAQPGAGGGSGIVIIRYTATSFTLTDLNATDADVGDVLTWSVKTNATNGVATVSGSGSNPTTFTYAPNADFNGSDSFVVQVSDGVLNDTITVNVTVNAADDPFDNWLANLPAGQQSYDSDPDNDGIANLLEYAFGGDPTKTDQAIVMPTLDTSGGFLKLTFCHLKASLDPNLKYMPEISSSLKVAWSTDGLTTMGAPEGVLQDNLPDGKPFATSDYTRVTVTADKSMVEAVTKQFLRISVIRE